MISVEATTRNNKLSPLPVGWANTDQVIPKTRTVNTRQVGDVVLRELHLTGSHLLIGCICFLSATGLFLWALLNLWLFEP